MSYYVKAINNTVQIYPYSIQQLRLDNPSISFPKVMTDEQLANYNVYPVVFGSVEEPSDSEYIEQNVEPTYADGVWTMHFTLKHKKYWPDQS